jgi:hypothetical protein
MKGPTPPNMGDAFVDGASYTITGTGFGTKTPAYPILYDRGDTVYTNGVEAQPYTTTADGATVSQAESPYNDWSYNAPKWATDADFGKVFEQQVSTYTAAGEAHDTWLTTENDSPWPAKDTNTDAVLYARWYFIPPGNPWKTYNSSGGLVDSAANKFHRIQSCNPADRFAWTKISLTDQGFPPGDDENDNIVWIHNWVTTTPSSVGKLFDSDEWDLLVGNWTMMELHMDGDVLETVRTYINGQLNIDTALAGSKSWIPANRVEGIFPLLFGVDPIGSNYYNLDANPTNTFSLSHYYLDNTPQRVECSDQSTWSAAQTSSAGQSLPTRQVQYPTSWSNTSITFTAVKNNLPDSPIYAYVFDTNGDVINSNGIQVI